MSRPIRAKVAFRRRDLGGLLASDHSLAARVASESLVGASITRLARVDADLTGTTQLERT